MGTRSRLAYFDPSNPLVPGNVPAWSLPVLSSSMYVHAAVGQPFRYQISSTAGGTNFRAIGLPPGFSLNSATGVISGTFSANGIYRIPVRASNSAGMAAGTLTIAVGRLNPAPVSARQRRKGWKR